MCMDYFHSHYVARKTPKGVKLSGRDEMPCKKVLEKHWHEREHCVWKQMVMLCMIRRIVFWLRH